MPSLTHQQRILQAARGEMPDCIPYVPRLEVWYNANRYNGTLPEKYSHFTKDQIARAEGWPLYSILPESYDTDRGAEASIYRVLGLYPLKEVPYRIKFAANIEVQSRLEGQTLQVSFHTPVGSARATTTFTPEMLASGATHSWVQEHILKKVPDYKVVAYLFENMELVPAYDEFEAWKKTIGEDGLPAAVATESCSPMHLIQKEMSDATAFFYHYHDYAREMRSLAEAVDNFFGQALDICAAAPADAVVWGANIDSTLTPPPYLEKEILPWMRQASEKLRAAGKIVFSHTDGENHALMQQIRRSGIDVAESVCPYPMTRVKIDEYYRRWSDRLTIMGGIPAEILIPTITSDTEFEGYLDYLFKAVVPGTRMIFGVTDMVPPDADFSRMVRLGQRVASEGRLPLKGGAYRAVDRDPMDAAEKKVAPSSAQGGILKKIQENIYQGDDEGIQVHVRNALDDGLHAGDILQLGMIAAMMVIGERFKRDELFMPEVLLSARAMNAGLFILEPHLTGDAKKTSGRVLIGTVKGDLHDIGKNMVIIMLRGVGYEIKDLGINVAADAFVAEVKSFKPDILGLSALLTTTMPEMEKVIQALEEAGLRRSVQIMVGGAPVSEKFAKQIGADGYAETAGDAVSQAKRLLVGRTSPNKEAQ